MMQQTMLTNRQIIKPYYYRKIIIKNVKSNEIIEILFVKQAKSNKIISFTLPFIVAHSKIRREKRQLRNRLFAHEGHLFPSEIHEKRPEYDNFGLFLQPSIISLYKKSSLYFKIVDFLPKNDRYISFRNVEFIEIVSKERHK